MVVLKIIDYLYLSKRNLTTYLNKMVSPIVTLKEGKVRGSKRKLDDGRECFSFKGIPYAQPPVGSLRFKAPLLPKPWSHVLDAVEHGAICPQWDVVALKFRQGEEDCLFINVYTPTLQTDSKLPVMIYVHEGGFQSGSGNERMYGPDFLIQQDVILVTFNYRLEVFGFLCLDIPEVPGNAGMKDMVEAMRWVQNNIKQFGGDPDNVTIFGASSGAASVTYLMMSPMTKGLFHKAIAQSGTCLAHYALDINPVQRAFEVGKFLGKDTTNPYELLNYLQSLPANNFVKLTLKMTKGIDISDTLKVLFAPVVERRFGDSEVFLPEKPLDLMLAGKYHHVPFITGYTSSEGGFFLKDEIERLDFINKYPSCLVPKDICMKVTENKVLQFGERIKQFYWGNRNLTVDDIEIIADIQSDLHFIMPAYRTADYYSKFCKSVFMYRFDLNTKLNWISKFRGLPPCKRVPHVDELFYIFKSVLKRETYEKHPELHKHVYRMTKLWTNFAKTSNPTPDNSLGVTWSPYTAMGKEYLQIDNELSVGRNVEKRRLDFWDQLYTEAGLPSIVKSKM